MSSLRGIACSVAAALTVGSLIAPLLFSNLALLACIGLWAYGRGLQEASHPTPDLAPAPAGWG